MAKKTRWDFLLDAQEQAVIQRFSWTGESIARTLYRCLSYLPDASKTPEFKPAVRGAIVCRSTIYVPRESPQEKALIDLWHKDKSQTIARVISLLKGVEPPKEIEYDEFLSKIRFLAQGDRLISANLIVEYFEDLLSRERLFEFLRRMEDRGIGVRRTMKTQRALDLGMPRTILLGKPFNAVQMF